MSVVVLSRLFSDWVSSDTYMAVKNELISNYQVSSATEDLAKNTQSEIDPIPFHRELRQ